MDTTDGETTVADNTVTSSYLDVEKVRADFPILTERVHDRRLVYLDSAATSLTPRTVIEAISNYYETTHANVHRGVYATAEEATRLYEQARVKVGTFVGAARPDEEIVFTKNATEAINLIAGTWGRANLHENDVVVLTEMEHHSNLVPWIMLSEQLGVELRYVPIDGNGRLDLSNFEKICDGAKLLCVAAMSNVLGTINPIAEMSKVAHECGALVVVDGAQSVPHLPVDVQELGADFLAFSGHKMMGPTGIGVLWAKAALLDAMPPFLGGGGMILDVKPERFLPASPPDRFEAGTPPIAEAVGLATAVDYLASIGMDRIRSHELSLSGFALDSISEKLGEDCKIFGPPAGDDRGGVMSFSYRDVHPHDIAQVLDQYGVCVRPGHHCAKPLMRKLGVSATARASVAMYNCEDDINILIEGLVEAGRLFG